MILFVVNVSNFIKLGQPLWSWSSPWHKVVVGKKKSRYGWNSCNLYSELMDLFCQLDVGEWRGKVGIRGRGDDGACRDRVQGKHAGMHRQMVSAQRKALPVTVLNLWWLRRFSVSELCLQVKVRMVVCKSHGGSDPLRVGQTVSAGYSTKEFKRVR